jgi:hypothetical protein
MPLAPSGIQYFTAYDLLCSMLHCDVEKKFSVLWCACCERCAVCCFPFCYFYAMCNNLFLLLVYFVSGNENAVFMSLVIFWFIW